MYPSHRHQESLNLTSSTCGKSLNGIPGPCVCLETMASSRQVGVTEDKAAFLWQSTMPKVPSLIAGMSSCWEAVREKDLSTWDSEKPLPVRGSSSGMLPQWCDSVFKAAFYSHMESISPLSYVSGHTQWQRHGTMNLHGATFISTMSHIEKWAFVVWHVVT